MFKFDAEGIVKGGGLLNQKRKRICPIPRMMPEELRNNNRNGFMNFAHKGMDGIGILSSSTLQLSFKNGLTLFSTLYIKRRADRIKRYFYSVKRCACRV